MTKQCKDCGNTFTMEDGEINFYKSKNLQLPNRCKSCRDKRKPTNQTSNNHNTVNNNRNSDTKLNQNVLFVIAFCIFAIGSIVFNEITSNSSISPAPSTSSTSSTPLYSSTYSNSDSISQTNALEFRTQDYLIEHFNKHGDTLGHSSASSYLNGANEVVNSSVALKRIQSDGDTAYFIEATEEFVVVSTDNYIRTYFKPNDGIDYFNRQ